MLREVTRPDGRSLTLAMDDVRPPGARVQAVVVRELRDELTGRAVRTPVTVSSDRAGLAPRATADGLAGLVGVPTRVFAHPDLATNAHSFEVTFAAAGYLPHRETVSLGPFAGFPGTFSAGPASVLALHRRPVVISGRVLRNAASPVPAPGAQVRIDAVWLSLPPATASPPADPVEPVALGTPLALDRGATATTVRGRALTPAAGEDKHLLGHAAAGVRSLRCSDRVNLAAGDVVAVDTADAAATEYLEVAAVDGSTSATAPATVRLAQPLARAHLQGATVRRVLVGVAGPANALARNAIAGDACVLLATASGLATADLVQVTDASQPDEYHRPALYSVTTDAGGFFRLPPLARVARLDLAIAAGTASATVPGFVPDYGARENLLDIVAA